MRIHLLGRPHVTDGEEDRPVRGHQTWALLTRLLLADRPPTRRELA